LLENFFVVLAECWTATRWHFGNAVDLDRAADRGGELAAGAFERNDDVV
jgi:hypothetical protein